MCVRKHDAWAVTRALKHNTRAMVHEHARKHTNARTAIAHTTWTKRVLMLARPERHRQSRAVTVMLARQRGAR